MNRKRNIIAGTIILLFSCCCISCNDATNDHLDTGVTDTMTMPAASPDHTDTGMPVTPPAIADTTAGPRTASPDSMPPR